MKEQYIPSSFTAIKTYHEKNFTKYHKKDLWCKDFCIYYDFCLLSSNKHMNWEHNRADFLKIKLIARIELGLEEKEELSVVQGTDLFTGGKNSENKRDS